MLIFHVWMYRAWWTFSMSFLDKIRLKETAINKGSSKQYFIKKFTAVFAKLDFNNGVSFSLFYLRPCTFLPSYVGLILCWNDSELSEGCASGVHCVKKCSNTEFYSGLCSIGIQKNTDQKKPRIWALFSKWLSSCFCWPLSQYLQFTNWKR